jgi:hypothetical protein
MFELCNMDISGMQRLTKRTAIWMTKMTGVNPAGTKSTCQSCQRDLCCPLYLSHQASWATGENKKYKKIKI